MLSYIIKRVLGVIPVLLCVSMLVFGFLRLIPGDPALIMLGERADSAEHRPRCVNSLACNKPVYEQYLTFLGNALRGDLGRSILRQEPVTQEILRRFPATIELALAALLIAVVVGIPAGVISAVRRRLLVRYVQHAGGADRRLHADFLARLDADLPLRGSAAPPAHRAAGWMRARSSCPSQIWCWWIVCSDGTSRFSSRAFATCCFRHWRWEPSPWRLLPA